MGSSWTWAALLAATLLAAGPGAAELCAALQITTISRYPGQADLLVVLGGESAGRVAEAARLFRAGRAKRILVSGAGDCLANRAGLLAGGVPPDAVVVDCASTTTWENAALAAPIVERLGARTVMLVTSWFHVPRAVSCFHRMLPGVRLVAAPVFAPDEGFWTRDGLRLVAAEYVKEGWYLLRYGALPFGLARTPPAPAGGGAAPLPAA